MFLAITFSSGRYFELEGNRITVVSVRFCHPHHPWDFLPWPQYSIFICIARADAVYNKGRLSVWQVSEKEELHELA
jgi:hypothetical protein